MTCRPLFFLAVPVLIMSFAGNGCRSKKEAGPTGSNLLSPTETITDPGALHSKLKSGSVPEAFIEKTYCFGTCPVFSAEIFPNGFLHYAGTANVDHIGEYYGIVTAVDIDSLRWMAAETGFFAMNDEYDNPSVTDLPATTIGIRQGKLLKKVKARYDFPPEFKKLDALFSRVIARTSLRKMEKENQD